MFVLVQVIILFELMNLFKLNEIHLFKSISRTTMKRVLSQVNAFPRLLASIMCAHACHQDGGIQPV